MVCIFTSLYKYVAHSFVQTTPPLYIHSFSVPLCLLLFEQSILFVHLGPRRVLSTPAQRPISTLSLKSAIALLNVFALANRILTHGIVTEFYTDGVKNTGFATDMIYKIQNGNPVPDIAAWSTTSTDRAYVEPNNMQTLDINCHQDAKPGVLTAEVAAGGKVDFFWADWPHNTGPVLTCIANRNGDCSDADKATLKWIKIDEAGYENDVWAGQKLMDNNFT
jgi:cellulase